MSEQARTTPESPPSFAESAILQQLHDVLTRNLGPMLAILAPVLNIRAAICVADTLVVSPADYLGVRDPDAHSDITGAANWEVIPLDIPPAVGPWTLLLQYTPGSNETEETPSGSASRSPHEHVREALLAALGPILSQLAQHATTEALYAHQYMEGLSAIAPNIRSALQLLGVDQSSDIDDRPARPLAISSDTRGWIVKSLVMSEHLLRIERDKAVAFLSQTLPGFLPETSREYWEYVNPMNIMREVLKGFHLEASSRQIRIEVDPDGRASQMRESRVEPLSFRRMLRSLLINALKYSYHSVKTGDTHTERVIRIRCFPRNDIDGRTYAMSIQNYGIGIEPDELGLVRKPGYRGRLARQEVVVGTGLGLTDACAIAERHGGHITVRSKPLHGTTYLTTARIILPITRGELRENQDVYRIPNRIVGR